MEDSTDAGVTTEPDGLPSTTASAVPLGFPSTLIQTPIGAGTNTRTHATATYPPMTTSWKAPSHCTWTYNTHFPLVPGSTIESAFLDFAPEPGASTLSCYPDHMFGEHYTGTFSPATCPNGWTTVSLQVNTDQPEHVQTTTALCCSSDFSFNGEYCTRTGSKVRAVPILYNETATAHDVLSHSTTSLAGATIAVYPIRALFRDSDKAMLGLNDEDDLDDSLVSGKSHSLPLSARIGIGISVGIFILMLIGAGVWFLKRRDKAAARKHSFGPSVTPFMDGPTAPGMYVVGSNGRRSDETEISSLPLEQRPESRSVTETEGRLSRESRHEEIKAPVAQKAVQRRIDDLGWD